MTKAEQFARQAHTGQTYGEHDYVDEHVAKVVQILHDFGYRGGAIEDAGWLHDVLEDTPVSIEEVEDQFGAEVSFLVYTVTGVGFDRKERNQSMYDKIALVPKAAIVKLADRIANVEAGGKKEMYLKENIDFVKVVNCYVPGSMIMRLLGAFDV